MNGHTKSLISQIKILVKGTKEQAEKLNALIEKSNIEDTLIIKHVASRMTQETFNIFHTLEQTAEDHARKIFE